MVEMWKFETERFRVVAEIEIEHGYEYDGDDESGEIQAALDCGEMVAFDTLVSVYLGDIRVGAASLGASVYYARDVEAFFRDHRSADPMNRNCEAMRAAHGGNVSICHYFPDLVREAVSEARSTLVSAPRLRKVA